MLEYSHSWIFKCGCISEYRHACKINNGNDRYILNGWVESRYFKFSKDAFCKRYIIHCEECKPYLEFPRKMVYVGPSLDK